MGVKVQLIAMRVHHCFYICIRRVHKKGEVFWLRQNGEYRSVLTVKGILSDSEGNYNNSL